MADRSVPHMTRKRLATRSSVPTVLAKNATVLAPGLATGFVWSSTTAFRLRRRQIPREELPLSEDVPSGEGHVDWSNATGCVDVDVAALHAEFCASAAASEEVQVDVVNCSDAWPPLSGTGVDGPASEIVSKPASDDGSRADADARAPAGVDADARAPAGVDADVGIVSGAGVDADVGTVPGDGTVSGAASVDARAGAASVDARAGAASVDAGAGAGDARYGSVGTEDGARLWFGVSVTTFRCSEDTAALSVLISVKRLIMLLCTLDNCASMR